MKAVIKSKGFGTIFPKEGVVYNVDRVEGTSKEDQYGRVFSVTVEEQELVCLEHHCAHLNGGSWELIEEEDESED